MHFDFQSFVIYMAVLIIAITIHEFAHAITADRLGDPTPRSQGRISLLPPDHLDPLGTLMMAISALIGFGIGWGKPVLTNPRNFRNPRRDQAIVAIAGPISNMLQAVVFALLIRLLAKQGMSEPIGMFLIVGLTANLSLAFFNLIPIAPLDGHWILTALLPAQQAMAYKNFMNAYGSFIFLFLIIFERQLGIIHMVIGPPVQFFARLLLGG